MGQPQNTKIVLQLQMKQPDRATRILAKKRSKLNKQKNVCLRYAYEFNIEEKKESHELLMV